MQRWVILLCLFAPGISRAAEATRDKVAVVLTESKPPDFRADVLVRSLKVHLEGYQFEVTETAPGSVSSPFERGIEAGGTLVAWVNWRPIKVGMEVTVSVQYVEAPSNFAPIVFRVAYTGIPSARVFREIALRLRSALRIAIAARNRDASQAEELETLREQPADESIIVAPDPERETFVALDQSPRFEPGAKFVSYDVGIIVGLRSGRWASGFGLRYLIPHSLTSPLGKGERDGLRVGTSLEWDIGRLGSDVATWSTAIEAGLQLLRTSVSLPGSSAVSRRRTIPYLQLVVPLRFPLGNQAALTIGPAIQVRLLHTKGADVRTAIFQDSWLTPGIELKLLYKL